MKELIRKSYAKINIGLYIKEKRADGYHSLHSLFQEVSLHDILHIGINPAHKNIILKSNWTDIPLDEKNTAYQAALLLKEQIPAGIEIYLEKYIPHQAGLGGGSSNAASVLVALNELAELKLSKEKLLERAAEIGSDVPFFIDGTQAEVRGRGELISPTQIVIPYSIVIAKARNISFSTADIFRNYNRFLRNSYKNEDLNSYLESGEKVDLLMLRNDLEKAIEHPIIAELKEQFLAKGAIYTAMSGSGSSVFAFFDAEVPKLNFPNCDFYYCKAIR